MKPRTADALEIRAAAPADARALAEVKVESWRAAYAQLLPGAFLEGLSVPAEAAQWESGLRRFAADFRVACVANAVIGYAVSGPSLDTPTLGELFALYVRPTAWGQGVGRALMQQALHDLRGRPFAEAVLWVFEANLRTRRFYEVAGFLPDGGRRSELGQPVLRYRRGLQ